MDLRDGQSPVDGQVHRDNLTMLYAAQNCTSFDSFRLLAPGLGFTGSESFSFGGPNGDDPRWVIIDDVPNNRLLVIMCGMSNATQAGNILFGWSSPTSLSPSAFPYQARATSMLVRLRYYGVPGTWNKIRLIGHSYGGAIVQNMINGLQNKTPAGKFGVYTYGAPKPNYRSTRPAFTTPSHVRVFLQFDPVPNLPPSLEELTGYWRLLRNTEAEAWNRFIQMQTGYGVQSDGTMYAAENPALNSRIDYFQTLIAWLTGITAFGADAHSLDAYQRTMALTPTVFQSDSNWRSGRSHTSIETLTATQMNERRDADLFTAGANAAGNPFAAAQNVAPLIVPVPGERFRGGRANGHLAVLYAGQVVQPVRTKRARRQIVRYLNNMFGL